MEPAVEIWHRRSREAWIRGVDIASFRAAVEVRRKQLENVARGAAVVRVLNLESTPAGFIAGILAAFTVTRPVCLFLGTRRWSRSEQQLALALAQPDIIWGSADQFTGARTPLSTLEESVVCIPTGGTTGGLRFAVHRWGSLAAAVRGLQEWLGGGPINSTCFLPLHHVSGLMQVLRCFGSDGVLTLADWNAMEWGKLPPPVGERPVTSLVPTQLSRLFDVEGAVVWLRSFAFVFLGGAAAPPPLLDRARESGLRLAPCYGMTETAAQIAAITPGEFLAGESGRARALPHARLGIAAPGDSAAVSRSGEGLIRVESLSLFSGYFPDVGPPRNALVTDDRGILDAEGRVTVLGRADSIINTGGEKVEPGEVEAAVRATGMVADVAVIGFPDAEWGEVVVAVVAGFTGGTEAALREALRVSLAPHKIPKLVRSAATIPRNEAGKIDRAALRALIDGPA